MILTLALCYAAKATCLKEKKQFKENPSKFTATFPLTSERPTIKKIVFTDRQRLLIANVSRGNELTLHLQ